MSLLFPLCIVVIAVNINYKYNGNKRYESCYTITIE